MAQNGCRYHLWFSSLADADKWGVTEVLASAKLQGSESNLSQIHLCSLWGHWLARQKCMLCINSFRSLNSSSQLDLLWEEHTSLACKASGRKHLCEYFYYPSSYLLRGRALRKWSVWEEYGEQRQHHPSITLILVKEKAVYLQAHSNRNNFHSLLP